ncbi:hypothetical protein GCM10011490_09350 [Pseudoclavibacter endophyticus]|uniref:Uncharacterized protein n=1 Tax=Pseudoclavibacter endophyticus TaxID=1778590 RepID=A0A6H9WRN7_9MICO|nr:hypothetical protein [Pseudoclavibacter endophyticus]KAB1649607.1 hypothetical protein F8O04_05005 [Pseudoclavibacter endophyticus]GGA61264.1 hypothetical protein GCM10011490_09350 [Pseudoclavibacter endophyticus]
MTDAAPATEQDLASTAGAAPSHEPARSLWRSIPRGLWIGTGVAALVMAASMWWGVTFEATETARIRDEGDATMQGPIVMALLGVLVPIVVAVFLGAGVGGRFGILAAERRPRAGFGARFATGVLPALALTAGAVTAGTLVAVLACLVAGLTGLAAQWQAPLAFGALTFGVGVATAILGLVLSGAVASVMLRPARD